MTAPRDELAALLARVEAATGADRELDAAVAVALKVGCRSNLTDDMEYLSPVRRNDDEAEGTYWFHCRSGKSLRTASLYTDSVDVSLALVELKLPKTRVYIAREPDNYSRAEIVEGRNHSTRLLGDTERPDGEAALCVIASLLTALLQSEAGQGDGAGA